VHQGLGYDFLHVAIDDCSRVAYGAGYRSRAFGRVLERAGVRQLRTRPYRPKSNGKVERLNDTINLEWAYAMVYTSTRPALMAYRAGCSTTTPTAPTPPWTEGAPCKPSTTSPGTTARRRRNG
jgi:transposase InsO family protein